MHAVRAAGRGASPGSRVDAEDARAMQDRIGRELRRYQLAMRMVAHQARTQTICDFTGLTRERTKTLRREWNVSSDERRRGPSPTSLSVFFRSSRWRSEASSIAVFCRVLDAVPAERMPDAARRLPSLDRGERLCDVFEAYRTYFPKSAISFEQIVLLATALAQGEVVQLECCTSCSGTILVDRLAASPHQCSQCHKIGVSS
jgi:Flagellar transcriptional activator (FlhC)